MRRYAFPSEGATLISLEALQVNGSLALYAIFKSGEVVSVDPQTGATRTVANLLSTSAEETTVSSALTVDPATATLYACRPLPASRAHGHTQIPAQWSVLKRSAGRGKQ